MTDPRLAEAKRYWKIAGSVDTDPKVAKREAYKATAELAGAYLEDELVPKSERTQIIVATIILRVRGGAFLNLSQKR